MSKLLRAYIVIGAVSGFSGTASALPLDSPQANPGQIVQQGLEVKKQIEQETALPAVPGVSADPRQAYPVGTPGGPTFVLKHLVVDPSVFLSRVELDAITAKYIGKTVDISAVRRLVKEINDLFEQKGIVTAAAYLPPQTLKDGTVTIRIVEGRLGRVTTHGQSILSEGFIRSHLDQQPGEVIDVPAVNRNLALFNNTGSARIQALLQPGTQFGLSDIELAVIEPPRNQFQTFIDNQGNPTVGRWEVGGLYQLYAPFGIDDKMTVYTVKSQGNINGNIAYSLPFDPWGGRIGGSFTRGVVQDISGPYKTLNVSGTSQVAALNVTQPIVAYANWLGLVNGSYSDGNTQSSSSGMPVTDTRTQILTGGITISYASQGFSFDVAPTAAHVESYSRISKLTTDFNLYNGTVHASIVLPAEFVFTASGAWQVASRSLLPSDQLFQIGGPLTVRGFPANAVAGSRGFYTNLELHHKIGFFNDTSLDAFAFYDQGSVFNPFPAEQRLNSVGLGANWNVTKAISVDLTGAVPLNRAVTPQPGADWYIRVLSTF